MNKLGIGIITFNRFNGLSSLLKTIKDNDIDKNSSVAVFDDCSPQPNTLIALCEKNNISLFSTDKNRGVCQNKNNALFYFTNYTDCDSFLLLEDDVLCNNSLLPILWRKKILKHHHINYLHREKIITHIATRLDYLTNAGVTNLVDHNKIKSITFKEQLIYQSQVLTGQASGYSRSTISAIGYLDTNFKNYGFGHVDHTFRFLTYTGQPTNTFNVLKGYIDTNEIYNSHFDHTQYLLNKKLFDYKRTLYSDNTVYIPYQNHLKVLYTP